MTPLKRSDVLINDAGYKLSDVADAIKVVPNRTKTRTILAMIFFNNLFYLPLIVRLFLNTGTTHCF